MRKEHPGLSRADTDRADWTSQIGRAYWRWIEAVADVGSTLAAGRGAVSSRAAGRLASLVDFARAHSPVYRDLYQDLGEGPPALSRLPVVTRPALMARFDGWVSDREVNRTSVERFAADPSRVGHAYLGRYAVWKSSGTTGMPGLYLHDPSALAVYDALDALRLGAGALGPIAASPAMLATGARYAMVAATGGHYAGVASVERLRLLTRALGDGMRVFSIFDPLARLVAALNDWQPAFVATHPTVADTLAAERRAGRLHIRPAAFWLGGENLSIAQRARIREAFGCVVLEQYGTSECMSIACECACGSLHLNNDWVVLEPVDRDYRPVPAGTMSYTALLTNLANRVQPIIRYDLGDRILIDTRDCPCGSPLPVLRIEGRTDEVLRLKTASGAVVDLPPVALATVIEECAGTHPFQVVQSGPQTLELRFENGTGERYART
jgi:phenylacetate-coenzyme A ligase PaaK-like adenylate-forming protein